MADNNIQKPGQYAEWDRADTVLLCEPNYETLFGILETNSANFIRPFSLYKAKEEHQRFRKTLEDNGVNVIDLREAMLSGVIEDGELKEGNNLENLRDRALESLTYNIDSSIKDADVTLLRDNCHQTIKALHPKDLVDIILTAPTLNITYNDNALDPTSKFKSDFKVDPANNQYFMRDAIITTQKGVVVGNFSLEVRYPETENVVFALEQMGIEPVYRVEAPGTLEGGDFIPAGDFVLQGQGLLTNAEGVQQLLDHKAYGYVEVAVVRDERAMMDEMHLDTYFGLLSRDLAVLCENRFDPELEPKVDVYLPVGDEDDYEYKKEKTIGFISYLKDKDIEIIKFSKEEQDNFAPNFLLVDEKKLIGVSRAGVDYEKRLNKYDVETNMLNFDELTGGYGGPHCMSQAIIRLKK